jgi:arylsulfatase A-like enzyme
MAQLPWLRPALFTTLVAVGAVGVSSSRSRPAPNILLITLDTTRADHLGAYGFQSIATPNIDRLAREGVLFEQTSAAAPLTLPAHASLFTGRFPFGHGVRDNAGFVLDPHETTVAEILQQHGYHTAAFVGSYVLAAGRGLNQGFDTYGDEFNSRDHGDIGGGVRRPANEVTAEALAWLAQADSSPFFAWVHFYDAHGPYDPPEPYRSAYAGRPYDAEIAFMDSQIGRILAFLRQRGLLERTIVVVIGDHGESLGDHGEAAHGVFVYESVIRVPFIIRAPSARLGARVVDDVTRSIDVMPTLLDLLGIRSPAAADGTSLVPWMTGAVRSLNLEAYSESLYPLHRFGWSDLRALRAGRFKVIAAPRPELYDLQQDPFEEHNVYETHRAMGQRMIARLREKEALSRASASPDRSRADVNPDLAAKLATLGYLAGSGATRSAGDAGALPDPKDQMAVIGQGVRP